MVSPPAAAGTGIASWYGQIVFIDFPSPSVALESVYVRTINFNFPSINWISKTFLTSLEMRVWLMYRHHHPLSFWGFVMMILKRRLQYAVQVLLDDVTMVSAHLTQANAFPRGCWMAPSKWSKTGCNKYFEILKFMFYLHVRPPVGTLAGCGGATKAPSLYFARVCFPLGNINFPRFPELGRLLTEKGQAFFHRLCTPFAHVSGFHVSCGPTMAFPTGR